MNKPVSKLIFFPVDSEKTFNQPELLKSLANIEFIEPEKHSDNHYLPGNNFLSLITFLGCSPNINLAPIDNEDYCHISFIEQTEKTRCLGYTQTANPKCPHCKKRIAKWKIPDWQKAGSICLCDKCLKKTDYVCLNWKHECGFGRCGFEVSHIYPHEAVPGEKILYTLKQASGFEWDYCYTNS